MSDCAAIDLFSKAKASLGDNTTCAFPGFKQIPASTYQVELVMGSFAFGLISVSIWVKCTI